MDLIAQLIQDCDALLKAGRGVEVSKKLRSLNLAKIPREARRPLAQLCRRCELYILGLKILTPVIYPEKNRIEDPATGLEKTEFAALKMKIGSVKEALELLQTIDSQKAPESPLIKAYCHMSQWDYKPAVEDLRSYLKLNVAPYSALVAKVNLAASLISLDEFQESLVLVNELIAETKAQNYQRLLANCYELRSQIHLLQDHHEDCEKDLDSATSILIAQKTNDQLFIQKWRSILQARRENRIEPIFEFQKEAEKRSHWESVRASDFHMLKISFDPKRFQRLWWGTPYPAYRARLIDSMGSSFDKSMLGSSYLFGNPSESILDLRDSEFSSESVTSFQIRKQVHSLLGILLKDLYRPISVGALYADLFPGEYFNVFSSPSRVHQALRRARRWMEKFNVPCEIQELEGQYQLRLTGTFAFLLGAEKSSADSNMILLKQVRSRLSSLSSFSKSQLCQALDVSPSTALRFLNWAVENGHLKKLGTGRGTHYTFEQAPGQAA